MKETLPRSPSGLGKVTEVSGMPAWPNASHNVSCISAVGPALAVLLSRKVGVHMADSLR